MSVIVPLFNHAEYIGNGLQSIADDPYPRIELIIIDDGSCDNSFDVASQWLDQHAKRFERTSIRQQENAGIPATFNRLVKQSTGEFIFPLASDDMVAPGGINGLVSWYLDRCIKPTLLFSELAFMDSRGRPLPASALPGYKRDSIRLQKSRRRLKFEVVTRWGAPFQMHFYPRSLHRAFGGYDESLHFEDLYFALKAVASGRAEFAPIVSRRYRLRPGDMVTPGLEDEQFSPVPSRHAVLDDFNLAYRILIRLMNWRSNWLNRGKNG
ncbi:MAG: glycosyltransferase family 2 protein [Xanthomonadales bacterium]|nr:glycosyltransferase family 2 protein [Xanthomonadales bacterium]